MGLFKRFWDWLGDPPKHRQMPWESKPAQSHVPPRPMVEPGVGSHVPPRPLPPADEKRPSSGEQS